MRLAYALASVHAAVWPGLWSRERLLWGLGAPGVAGWLGRLRSLAGRPRVGAVGPLLLYANGRVQHAGVVVGFHDGADHAMRNREPLNADGTRNPGYNANLVSVRDYSAVTAACLMMRRELFEQVGGFPDQPLMEDVELSRRLRRIGRPACLRLRVVTSGRRWEHRGTWRTIALMWRLRLLYALGVAPERLARSYR